MKYYFSSSGQHYDKLKKLGAECFLLSFAVDANASKKMLFDDVIIDSGAFTVWNKGGSIDIDEYLKFCLMQNQEWTFINLDVIPSKNSTAAEIERCCQQGYENYLYLKKHLKNVMPVFHSGEDEKWLDKFMNETDYIGVGFGNDRHEKHRRTFLKRVFYKTQLEYKIHGLGYTSFDGLTQFPFYSVDSISYKSFNINDRRFMVSSDLNFFFRRNIVKYIELEKRITELWEHRGVKWE